jgi:hypothetical protein
LVRRPHPGLDPAVCDLYQPPPPARGIDIHSTEHSTEDTAGHEYSTVGHSGTARAGPTAQVDRTAQHSTQSHGAHSQEWHTPSHDPHWVGNEKKKEKNFRPGRHVFLRRGATEVVGQR